MIFGNTNFNKPNMDFSTQDLGRKKFAEMTGQLQCMIKTDMTSAGAYLYLCLQYHPTEPSIRMEMSVFVLFDMVTTSHMCPLSTFNVASVTEDLF